MKQRSWTNVIHFTSPRKFHVSIACKNLKFDNHFLLSFDILSIVPPLIPSWNCNLWNSLLLVVLNSFRKPFHQSYINFDKKLIVSSGFTFCQHTFKYSKTVSRIELDMHLTGNAIIKMKKRLEIVVMEESSFKKFDNRAREKS